MRTTVCEFPHETEALGSAWKNLCAHTIRERTDLLVLPEFAFAPPVWEAERFDASIWAKAEIECNRWMARFGELGAKYIIGARPVTADGKSFNEGFVWSLEQGCLPLRRKRFLPEERGGWEARWFARGDAAFPVYFAGPLAFGLNICTELWALDTYTTYAAQQVQAIVTPRATAAATTSKWLAVGTVAAVRAGAFSLSSNRVHADGSCGGVGWIISPDGELLGCTSQSTPACTVDIDLAASATAKQTYPRYVFAADA